MVRSITVDAPSRTDASGFVLVALGAALWGTDALFRRGLASELPAPIIVGAEHLLLSVILLPFIWSARHVLKTFTLSDWLSLVIIGAGSSALATVLFTSSFTYGDPNTPLLLQKLQPVIAVGAAGLILGERVRRRFALYLGTAMVGVFLITFPDPTDLSVDRLTPALLASGAAALWALGTVLGRRLTVSIPPTQLTALRLGIGLLALIPVISTRYGLGEAAQRVVGAIGPLVLLSLIPGLFALLVYYRGLRATPASAAAVAELAFPLTAISINFLAFDAVLSGSQWFGLGVLLTTILVMARVGGRSGGAEELGIISMSRSRPSAVATIR